MSLNFNDFAKSNTCSELWDDYLQKKNILNLYIGVFFQHHEHQHLNTCRNKYVPSLSPKKKKNPLNLKVYQI